MKLRIGDKVRFLNEIGEGVVVRIKDKSTVIVEMADGFEIPFASNQLVPIQTELILDKNAENIELDPEAHLSDALYFLVEPDHELPSLRSDYRLYLFNASSYHLLYTYSIKDEAHFQTIKHGEAGPFQKIQLKTSKVDFFRDYPFQKIEALFFKNTFFKEQSPVSEIIQITPKQLAQSDTIRHEEFQNPVFAFLLKDNFATVKAVESILSESDVAKLRTVKEFQSKSKVSKSTKEYLKSLEKEVDLHIEELVENVNGLSKHDMLHIQLEKFEKELDTAIEAHMKKIIFIHGVGNGRLKQEIIAQLKNLRGVTFHDASFKEYGYGATQVNIL